MRDKTKAKITPIYKLGAYKLGDKGGPNPPLRIRALCEPCNISRTFFLMRPNQSTIDKDRYQCCRCNWFQFFDKGKDWDSEQPEKRRHVSEAGTRAKRSFQEKDNH